MQKYYKYLHENIWIAILASLATIALQSLRGGMVLSDPFHHGEYFASAVIFFTTQIVNFQPLTIHGALDFIPALMARAIWGAENYFLPTYFLYKLMNIASSIMLLIIVYEITKDKAFRFIILLSMGVAAPLLVGYKDIYLLLSLSLFLILCKNPLETAFDMVMLVIFGVLVGLGLFWSFDRGISGVASFGVASLFLTFKNKRFAISLAAFFVSVFLISFFSQTFSIENYVENIKVLLATSSQWSYGWQRSAVVLSIFAVIFNLVVIGSVLEESYRNKSLISRMHELIMFSLLSLFMLKIGINRADWGHIYSSLWAPMLMLFYFYNERIFTKAINKILVILLFVIASALSVKDGIFLPAFVTGAIVYIAFSESRNLSSSFLKISYGAFVALSLLFTLPTSTKYATDKYLWLGHVFSPPNNLSSSIEGMRWVSDRLLERKSNCVFDLSNNGIINGLTSLPSCSRFTYLVYAGQKHEQELINSVRLTSPKAIVYSSTYWSYAIDGRSMRDRFPDLDIFLLEKYPTIECANGYCIRYLRE